MRTKKAFLSVILLKNDIPFVLFCVCAAAIAVFGSSILLALIYLTDSLLNLGLVPSDEADKAVTLADFFWLYNHCFGARNLCFRLFD